MRITLGKSLSILLLSTAFFFVGSVYAETAAPVRGTLTGAVEHELPSWFKESFLDLQADVAEAKAQKKHVILFFHLENCPYCEKMLTESFSASPLKEYIQQHFDVIALNTKGDREVAFKKDQSFSEKELAEKLKVQYTPTILFLDADNNAVARLNGYRSAKRFESILHYVNDEAYKNTTLEKYLDEHSDKNIYKLRDEAMFKKVSDFSTIKTPLAVIFEDSSCDECDRLHDKVLNRADVQEEMKAFTVVRLDAASTDAITDNEGNKTTPKDWAAKLNLTYRPGIILFDKGKEVARIDGMLFSFHFKEMFRYISGGHYEKYNRFGEYIVERQKQLLDQGVNINITE